MKERVIHDGRGDGEHRVAWLLFDGREKEDSLLYFTAARGGQMTRGERVWGGRQGGDNVVPAKPASASSTESTRITNCTTEQAKSVRPHAVT